MDESNKLIKEVADKYNLETRLVDGYNYCPIVKTDSEAYKYVDKTIEKVFDKLPRVPYVMTGGTDARFYGEICEACIRFSPIVFDKEQMKGMLGLNECVETSSLPGAVDFYKEIITNAQ